LPAQDCFTSKLTKVGSGSAFVYGNNTYSGETVLAEGFLSAYHSNALGSTIGGTIVSNETQLTLTAGATFPEPLTLFGTLSSGAGNNTYVGPITLAESNTTLRIELTTPLTVNAVISGSGGFTKTRGGTLTLNSNNTYTGTTTVSEGTVLVNGSQPQSPITITSGTLGGTGTVGTIISSGGTAKTLAPGGSPGILSCSNVTLNSSTTFTVELNGTTPGSGHDQLNVVGAVNLGNCSLNVTLGFTLSGSESFVIINNDESDAVTGTFSGLAEGATFNVGTNQLQITYVGGTGNDVVLFRPSAPPAVINSISVLTNGHAQIQATGLPNLTYGVEAATNLNPVIQWTDLGTAVADGSGEFSFTDTNAPAYPMRFYRVVSP
jgi:fibronectin-binding autotransporter adhesin